MVESQSPDTDSSVLENGAIEQCHIPIEATTAVTEKRPYHDLSDLPSFLLDDILFLLIPHPSLNRYLRHCSLPWFNVMLKRLQGV